MAIKDILVHLDASEAGFMATQFALSLAAHTGAHVTAAGIAIQYMPMASVEDVVAYNEAFAQLTEQSRTAAEAAYKKVAAAAPAGVESELVMIEAPAQIASDRFGELGRHFDLSIVGHGSPESQDEENLMVQGALFGSGKPVFLVPFIYKGPAKLGKVMVCWDGGIPAARAVAGSLPLLRRAGRVEVVRVSEQGQTPKELPGFNITRHLARHGVTVTLTGLPSAMDAGSAILSYARDSAPDYIVMGGYGHWKLKEFVFGGTTRTILSSTTVPIFMAH